MTPNSQIRRLVGGLKKAILTIYIIFISVIFLSCSGSIILHPAPHRTIANDFNSDGIADILIGAAQENTGGLDAGAAYVFYGSNALAASISASSANVKLIGETTDDQLGSSVASGDVNNDGIADIIVGAPFENTGGSDAGAVYVFYGSTSLASSIDASLANVKLTGEDADDRFGTSITSGDVNKDGIADIIVGATGDDSGGSNAGAAYIFYGSSTLSSSIDASVANVKLVGENANDFFGQSAATGDVNNSGISDIIVGAIGEDTGGGIAGAVYVFYGSTSLAASIDASAANVKIIGEDGGDQLGISVATGDVNGSGILDILAGADQNTAGGSAAGAAYVFYGSASLASSIDASAANVKLIGEDDEDNFGISISSGDVNNNGITDILVGAQQTGPGISHQGAAYVFYGSTSLPSSIDASLANVKFSGEAEDDTFGISVSSGGDINLDGIIDLIVGATGNAGGGTDRGAAYIQYGSSSLSSKGAATMSIKISGQSSGFGFGQSCSI